MKKLSYYALLTLLTSGMLFSCKKDDAPDDEEELITSVILTFTPDGGGTPVSFSWRDILLSGTPEIDTILLSPNATYSLRVAFLNEAENPAENVTEEIEEEDDEHQIFYLPTPISLMELSYLDQDEKGLPVGLSMRVQTGDAGAGNLRVVLKHAPGIKDGNLATGSTDVDVVLPVKIQ